MAKKEPKLERIVLGTDRKNAQKIRNMFMKILSKDKKSDGLNLQYSYRSFRKKAEYTIEGNVKTVAKCIKAFDRFVLKQEKTARKIEEQKNRAIPVVTGKYYTMKSAKERKHRV